MPAWWERRDVPTVEERLAYLEGRIGNHTTTIDDVRADIRELRTDIRDVRTEVRELRAQTDKGISRIIGIHVGMLLMIASAALAYFFK